MLDVGPCSKASCDVHSCCSLGTCLAGMLCNCSDVNVAPAMPYKDRHLLESGLPGALATGPSGKPPSHNRSQGLLLCYEVVVPDHVKSPGGTHWGLSMSL